MTGARRLVSIVIPVFNEESNVMPVHAAVRAVMEPLRDRYDYEIVFTDNHSTDGTFAALSALAGSDPYVKAVRFWKNVGFQRSILQGFAACKGDAAIQLDADLQDPPELIPEFLQRWEEGFDVVYGVRRSRQEGWLLTMMRKAYYRLVDAMSADDLPHDAGDFRLISRRVIDELASIRDHHPYIRGTVASLGLPQVGIPYDRNKRLHDTSKFSKRKLFELAFDGVLAHSIVPLRIATYTGLAVTVAMVVAIIGYVTAFALGQEWPRGFATTTVLLLLGIALNALFLGIIGEYIGRIYQQVRSEPRVLVERRLNLPE